MSQGIKTVSDSTFKTEVLDSPQPVLVDYWAEWCGPCRMIAPIVEESALEHSQRLRVAKLNIEENAATARRYGIRNIPTLMLFRNGEPVATHVGSLSRGQLQAFIAAHT